MNDDQIRERVQARLSDGILVRHLHVLAQPMKPGQPVPEAMLVGSALNDPCAVCDERGTQIRYNAPSGHIAFHSRCHDIWKEEAARPVRRG